MIDYRKKFWGHSIEFDKDVNEDGSFDVTGFCSPVPTEGDEFLHNFSKGLGVCVFTEVKPCGDPKDMYFGKAGLIRYATDEDLTKLNKKNDGLKFL